MRDETLDVELRRLLPGDEVAGAFVGLRGPRYGVEAFVTVLVLPAIFGGASTAVTLGLAGLWFLGVELFRRRYTIALTDEEIAVVANSRWRHRQPKRVERRYPAANNLHMSDEHAGDKRVRVGAMLQLWVIGRDLDEARRLCRLAGET